MNKTRQLLALLKFQAALVPLPIILAFPLALVSPYYIPLFIHVSAHPYYPGLEQQLTNQNFFFAGFIGFMLLAPEMMMSTASSAQWPTGTEFLMTRAVDRRLVFRARAVLYYLVVLTLPLCGLPLSLGSPTLRVGESGETEYQQQQVLDHMAGSTRAEADNYRHEIIIPNGNPLVQSWRIWSILCLVLGTQIVILLIYPLKYRRFILWGVLAAVVGIPLYLTFSSISKGGGLAFNEVMFFGFVAHQGLVWVFTIAAVLLGQVWCERRFARMEH
jgi:hypothetical protein